MSTDNFLECANCGKGEESSGELKLCTACKMVKYCSRDCQKAHRSQHKKECRKRAAELHNAKLFKQPPQKEDCPICFLKLPTLRTGERYESCCGNFICCGCMHAMTTSGKKKCPFCRTPTLTSEEAIERMRKRMEAGNVQAIHEVGCYYSHGSHGFPQDHTKALELWHRSAELGCASSYACLSIAYSNGAGVERDEKKAKHYCELAAIGGYAGSRHNLGVYESDMGNFGRALKHFMIAIEGGYNKSLKSIQGMYSNGYATKQDYARALKGYQAYVSEIRSDDRDKAAAFDDEYKYYE